MMAWVTMASATMASATMASATLASDGICDFSIQWHLRQWHLRRWHLRQWHLILSASDQTQSKQTKACKFNFWGFYQLVFAYENDENSLELPILLHEILFFFKNEQLFF